MRRPITLALALFVACSSDKVGPPPAPPVNWASLQPQPRPDAGQLKPTEREALVASAYAKALADFGTLPKLLGESANMRFGKQTAHGREAALAMHESIFGAFAQRTVATSRVWMNERYQAIEFSITGSQTRDWMGLAATQKQATIKGIMLVWTSDDGSIEDVHVMFDVAQVKAQLLGAGDLTGRACLREHGLAGRGDERAGRTRFARRARGAHTRVSEARRGQGGTPDRGRGGLPLYVHR